MANNVDQHDLIPVPTPDDIARINEVWRVVADSPHVVFNTQNRMDLWLLEQRLRSERFVGGRFTRATWVLVLATVVLALATIALVFVTLKG